MAGDRSDPPGDWIHGIHAVAETLRATPERVRRVLVAQGRRDRRMAEVLAVAAAAGVRVESVDVRALRRVVDGAPTRRASPRRSPRRRPG